MNKHFRRIWNIFIWLLLILALTLLFFFAGIKVFGIQPFIINSPSMHPLYKPGSMIFVKPFKAEELKPGDIVTFYFCPNITATHKIDRIDYENELIYTFGINNFDLEGNQIYDVQPVSFKDVVGIPIFNILFLGKIYFFITSSPGIYLVSSLCIIVAVISIKLETQKSPRGVEINNLGKEDL